MMKRKNYGFSPCGESRFVSFTPYKIRNLLVNDYTIIIIDTIFLR